MESVLASLLPFIPQAAIPLVICVCFTIWIQSKRKETKNERDKDSEAIHDKILSHDFEISRLKGDLDQQRNLNSDLSNQINILSQSVAKFSVAVDMLSESVKEIREEIRNDRRKKD